jgi:hypothetical protein
MQFVQSRGEYALRVIQSGKNHQDVAHIAIPRMTQVDSVVEVCWEILPTIFVQRCFALRTGLEDVARHVSDQ